MPSFLLGPRQAAIHALIGKLIDVKNLLLEEIIQAKIFMINLSHIISVKNEQL